MKHFKKVRQFVLLLIATSIPLVTGWGCSGKPSVSSSTDEATVKGKVVIMGKPATKGEITFDPANYQRKDVTPRSAAIGPDGSYSVTTLLGENRVTISSPLMPQAGRLASQEFIYDVKQGENTYDVEVKQAD